MTEAARTPEDTAIERPHRDRLDQFERLKRYEAEAAASERRAKARRRRMRRIPSLWVRLTALAVFLVAILIGMVGLTLKAVRPYREAGVEARRLAATRRQIADLDQRNAALRRQVAYLNTPDGVAGEAHKMGLLRPNEIPLVIEGTPGLGAAGGEIFRAPAEAAPRPASLFRRFWRHLLDL